MQKDYNGLKIYISLYLRVIWNIFKTSRIPKSEILKHREGILIGASFREGEIFKAITDYLDDDRINDIIDFYDYFEISPPVNCTEQIRSERFKDYKEIEDVIKEIYKLGKKNEN